MPISHSRAQCQLKSWLLAFRSSSLLMLLRGSRGWSKYSGFSSIDSLPQMAQTPRAGPSQCQGSGAPSGSPKWGQEFQTLQPSSTSLPGHISRKLNRKRSSWDSNSTHMGSGCHRWRLNAGTPPFIFFSVWSINEKKNSKSRQR